MKEIGITGGIGSGKSYVSRIFKELGFSVYDADKQAKALYTSNSEVKQQVIASFGADIYTSSGELNRAKLAGIVFADKAKLEILNRIVHPATREDYRLWRAQLKANGYPKPLLFREAAILF